MKRTVTILFALIGIVAIALIFVHFKKDDIVPVTTDVTTIDSSKILAAEFDGTSKMIKVTFKDFKTAEVAPQDAERVEVVEVVDINYDGIDDLQITESAGAYNASTYFLAQNPKTHAFVEYDVTGRPVDGSDPFPGLGFASFDQNKRIIVSSFKGRGLGDIYSEETFSFQNDKWIKVQNESQDMLGDYLSESNSGYYVRTTITYSSTGSVSKKEFFKVKTEGDLWDLIPVTEAEVRQKGLID